jgi:YhgE/Pip-like protein
VLILLITITYIGSLVNPAGHLRGLPILVVNQDAGANTPKGHVNFGEQVVTGLRTNAAVARPLRLQVVSLAKADQEMDKGADFGTLIIPTTFSASLPPGRPAARGRW